MIRERQVNGWAGALCPRLTPRPKSHKSHVSHVSHAQPLQNPLGASWRRIENRGLLMWYDPRKALAQLGDLYPPQPLLVPHVAQVARVARPHTSKSGASVESVMAVTIAHAGASGLFPAYKRADPHAPPLLSDPDTYLAALTLHGNMTYGAAAVALGWGATRAWQAEAALVAEGRATLSREGRAAPA